MALDKRYIPLTGQMTATPTASAAPRLVTASGNGKGYIPLAARPVSGAGENNGGLLGGVGYLVEKTGLGFVSGVEGIWDYTAGGIARLFGEEDWAREQFDTDWLDYGHADEWYDPSKGWQVAGDVAGGIGTSLPAMAGVAAGAAIAGASGLTLSPLAAGIISGSIAGLGAAGNATKEAYRETGELGGREFGYGALSGATEAGLELLTGGLGKGTGRIATSLAKRAAGETAETVTKLTGKTLVKTLAGDFASEALEEGLSEILSPVYQRLTWDPEADNATPREVMYAALVGGLSGLVMSGGQAAVNSASGLISGNRAVESGSVGSILSTAKQITNVEGRGETGQVSFKLVKDTYDALSASLETTGGRVETVKQRMLLGQLKQANVAAILTPFVERSALNILQNAEAVAERYSAFGMKGPDGSPLRVTAEDIRSGVETGAGQAALVKSLRRALSTNSTLATLAVADATGHITMDTRRFSEAKASALRLASGADVNRFIETATDEEKTALGARMGISDWNALTREQFAERATELLTAEDRAENRLQTARIGTFKAQAASAPVLPRTLSAELSDGVYRLADASLGVDVGLLKEGEQYHIYDYTRQTISRALDAREAGAEVRGAWERLGEDVRAASDAYTWESLVSKPDLPLTVVDDTQLFEPSAATRRAVIDGAVQNAAAVGRMNENGNAVVRVRDTGTDVIVGRNGVKHGLDRRLNTMAPVVLNIGSILQNSIRINELNPRSENVSDAYVLIGAAKNKNGQPYIVESVVNRHTNEIQSVDVLYSVNAKTEKGSTRLHDADLPANAECLTDPTISIAHLLDFVNRLYPDILPKNVLEHYERTERAEGVLGESVRYALREPEKTKMEPTRLHDARVPAKADYVTGSDNSIAQNQPVVKAFDEKRPYADVLIERARMNRAASEIDAWALEQVPEYAAASEPNRQAVRMTVRQARAAAESTGEAIDDGTIRTVARVALRSGMSIVFDGTRTEGGDAAIRNGTIYIDPHVSRERLSRSLLLHEAGHALMQGSVTESRSQAQGSRKLRTGLLREAFRYMSPERFSEVSRAYAAKYAEQGLSPAQYMPLVGEEVAMTHIEDVLGSPDAWEYILAEEPTAGQRLLSFFSRAARDYATDDGLSAEARKLRRTYKSLFEELSAREAGRNAERLEGSEAGNQRNILYDINQIHQVAIGTELTALEEPSRAKLTSLVDGNRIAQNQSAVKASDEKRPYADVLIERARMNRAAAEIDAWASEQVPEYAAASEPNRQAVVDTKARTLYGVSAYIGTRDKNKGASQLINGQALDATSENGSVVAPNKSIAQNQSAVKPSEVKKFALKESPAPKTTGAEIQTNHAGFARDKYYDRQIDGWKSLQEGAYVKVGEIAESSAINRVGIPLGRVFFDASKINKVLTEHGDHLTTDALKAIPDTLADPIAISRYDEQTVTVFGSIMVQSSPVIVGVMVTKDRSGKNTISKIRTVHARRDVANMLRDDNTLYLNEDKKRTRRWFQALGINVPLGGTRFGFIDSIAQNQPVVKASDEKRSYKSARITSNQKGQSISPPFDVQAPNRTPDHEWSLKTAREDSIAQNQPDVKPSEVIKFALKESPAPKSIGADIDDNTLYLNEDKKRTRRWFQALGNNVPLGGTRFGFIDSIAQNQPDVKPSEVKKFALKEENAKKAGEEAYEEITRVLGEEFSRMYENGSYDGASVKRGVQAKMKREIEALMGLSDRRAAAEAVADRLLQETVVEHYINASEQGSVLEERRVLSDYRGKLDLSGIRADLQSLYGDDFGKVARRWGKSRGGLAPDGIVSELEGRLGHAIEVSHPADVVALLEERWQSEGARLDKETRTLLREATDSESYERTRERVAKILFDRMQELQYDAAAEGASQMYDEAIKAAHARARIELARERKQLSQEYKEKTLAAWRRAEEKLRAEKQKAMAVADRKVERAKERQYKAEEEQSFGKMRNRIAAKADELKDMKLGTFANATQAENEVFKGLLGEMARVNYRGNMNISGTRDIFKRVNDWYTSAGVKEGLLGYQSTEEPGLYVQAVADRLSKIAAGTEPFDLSDHEAILDVLSYFQHFVESWGRVWKRGQWVEASVEAERYVGIIRANEQLPEGLHSRMGHGKYTGTFADPMSLARAADKYAKDGFFTETLEDMRDAAITAQVKEMELKRRYDAFVKKNRAYLKRASTEEVEYHGARVQRLHLIGLCMTLRRTQAQRGLVENGFVYKDIHGRSVRTAGYVSARPDGERLSDADIRRRAEEEVGHIRTLLTETDKEYMRILEGVYNGDARALKEERDLGRMGFTNVMSGYYYPIVRDGSAKSIDTSMAGDLDRVSNASFNKNTKRGARQKLLIESADVVFNRHVRAVSQYYALSPVIDTYNMVYNLDISGNRNDPVSVKTAGETAWGDGGTYLKRMLSDIQGISAGDRVGFLEVLRGGYAKSVLGANPKVWASQLSSLIASTTLIDPDSLIKGYGVTGADVDKYCELAELRHYENSAALAQGLLERPTQRAYNAVSRVGDAAMVPIGWWDRHVIHREFAACQVQVAKDGGPAVGTEANKVAAGRLLREVILETQQNAVATERSAAMRSTNTFLRTVTMFSADAMKGVGRVLDGVGEVSVIKAKRRAATDPAVRASLDADLKAAKRRLLRAALAVALQAAYMVGVTQLFKHVYNKDRDEDESIALELLGDLAGNLVGGLPIVRDVIGFFIDGFEMEDPTYGTMNDFLSAVRAVGDILTGETTAEERNRAIRNLGYATAGFLGLPVRNLYNVLFGLTKRFSPETAYRIDSVFYKKSYQSELASAMEAGDEGKVGFIMGLLLDERMGTGSVPQSVSAELTALARRGIQALPRTVPEEVTVDGITYALTEAERAAMQGMYAGVGRDLERLFARAEYAALGDEAREAAIRAVYEQHFHDALYAATGIRRGSEQKRIFTEVLGADRMALLSAKVRGLESDRAADGTAIPGSKRRKVLSAINSLHLSGAQKLLMLCAQGYSIQDGDIRGLSAKKAKRLLIKYIVSMKGKTVSERAALAEACGFEVQGNRILTRGL